jgi:hypothetical protein
LAFEHVVVEVTQACHHRCLHCYNYWRQRRAPVKDPQTLSRAEILELIRKVRLDTPLRQVGLSASRGFQPSAGVIGSSSKLPTRMAICTCAWRGTDSGRVMA